MTDAEYAVKLNAEAHIDELAAVSVGKGGTRPETHQHLFSPDGFFYQKAYFMDKTGYYELSISIGKNGRINTIYNVGKIDKTPFPTATAQRPTRSKTETETGFLNSMPQPRKSVNENVANLSAQEQSELLSAAIEAYHTDKSSEALAKVRSIVNAMPIDALLEHPLITAAGARAKFSPDQATYLIDTPERNQMRAEWGERLSSMGSYSGMETVDGKTVEAYNGDVRNDHIAFIIIGQSAAGKSTIANPISQQYAARIYDSDVVKKMIPEFDDGYGTGRVHRESKNVMLAEFDSAIKDGTNIVLPIVGKDIGDVTEPVADLKANGYSVYLVLNELDAEIAAKRAINRYFETGRFVDPNYILEQGGMPLETYRTLLQEEGLYEHPTDTNNQQIQLEGTDRRTARAGSSSTGGRAGLLGEAPPRAGSSTDNQGTASPRLIDGFQWFNNDVEYGQPPRLVEEHFAEGAVRRGYEIAQMEKAEHMLRQYSAGSGQPGETVNVNVGIDAAGDRTYNNQQGSVRNGNKQNLGTEDSPDGAAQVDAGRGARDSQRSDGSAADRTLSNGGLYGRANRGHNKPIRISDQHRSALDKAGVTDFGLSVTEDHQAFSDALARMRAENIDGASVDGKSVAELEGSITFMNADGTAGGAVEPDGNVVAVFKNRKRNKMSRAGVDVMLHAVALGGNKCDACSLLLPCGRIWSKGGANKCWKTL